MKPNFKSLEFIYQDTAIHFLLGNQGNVMINATDMAKAFNKKITHFMENENTKRFISVCLNSRKSDYLKIKSQDDLFLSKQKKGTFMHKVLALKFASWLDAEFEFWIYSTIDNLIFGKYEIHKQKVIEIEQSKIKIKDLELKVRKGEYENAIDLLDEMKNLKELQKDKTKAIIQQTKIIQLELF